MRLDTRSSDAMEKQSFSKTPPTERFRTTLLEECLRHALQYSLSINTHKGPFSKAANFAPSNAQSNPNDNQDTMRAGWQGTELKANNSLSFSTELFFSLLFPPSCITLFPATAASPRLAKARGGGRQTRNGIETVPRKAHNPSARCSN